MAYLCDHLGTTRAVVNQDGIVVETRDYAPFGEEIAHAGVFALEHRFTAQPQDDQAGGLYNYGARFYHPKWGRFISPDEVVQGFDSQGLNPFTYVLNRPSSMIDPDGRQAIDPSVDIGPAHSEGTTSEDPELQQQAQLRFELRQARAMLAEALKAQHDLNRNAAKALQNAGGRQGREGLRMVAAAASLAIQANVAGIVASYYQSRIETLEAALRPRLPVPPPQKGPAPKPPSDSGGGRPLRKEIEITPHGGEPTSGLAPGESSDVGNAPSSPPPFHSALGPVW